MTAVTLLPVPPGLCARGVGNLWLQHVVLYVVVLVPTVPVLGVVGWEPHSGRKQSLYVSVWCKLLAY